MKKRLVALALAVVMLVPMLILPVQASSYGNVPILIGYADVDYLAEQLLAEIPTEGLGPSGQIQAVYDWIILHCKRSDWDGTKYFDEDLVLQQSQYYFTEIKQRLRDGTAVIRPEMAASFGVEGFSAWLDSNAMIANYAYDMMLTRTGNCMHFSALFAVLLGHLGYDCHMIGGDFINLGGSRVEHKWNYVLVDGTYYWFDVRMDHAAVAWTGYIPYEYFMVADNDTWEMTHEWDHTYTDLLAQNPGAVIDTYNQILMKAGRGSTVGGFSDVFETDDYADAVVWAVDQGVTNGTGDGRFTPEATVTRAEAVTFLWRAMGRPAPMGTAERFEDVDYSDWYGDAVQWAVEQQITNGTGDQRFSPWDTLTQNQMVTLLYRTMGEPGKTGQGQWYEDAERWAGNEGLLYGSSQPYQSAAVCPRCDVVQYLYLELR